MPTTVKVLHQNADGFELVTTVHMESTNIPALEFAWRKVHAKNSGIRPSRVGDIYEMDGTKYMLTKTGFILYESAKSVGRLERSPFEKLASMNLDNR